MDNFILRGIWLLVVTDGERLVSQLGSVFRFILTLRPIHDEIRLFSADWGSA